MGRPGLRRWLQELARRDMNSCSRMSPAGRIIPVEHSAALIPFFEQLYRHQKGEMPGPIRILHYGDSHTAADEWTGAMRTHFQEKFGDGGPGYSFAGKPWNGYRRLDVQVEFDARVAHRWAGGTRAATASTDWAA